MDLNLDEQRLIAEFRKLSPSGKEELLAAATALLRKTVESTSSDQCSLQKPEEKPEHKQTPIFTE